MKKMLFISNITRKITNFTIPSIEACKSMNYEFHLASNCSGFIDDESKYNVMLHHININRNPFSIKNIKAYKELINLIRQEKFDVIHCNTPVGGILGRLCGKNAGVPKIIYTVHGFHFYKGAPILNRTLFKWAEMWLAHYTDILITINKEDYNAALKFNLRKDGKIYYVPGVGVDICRPIPSGDRKKALLQEIKAEENSFLIISVGDLNKNKNNESVIKAIGKLQNPNIHYIICGNGNRRTRLQHLCRKYNVEKNVHFLGYRTDINNLMKCCDIFVLPSFREGLSRSLMEAMSSGLPCIVSRIRGNTDLIKNNKGGYLCDPDDVNGFVKYIDILYSDKSLRDSMGSYNMKAITKFDINRVKGIIKKIYSNVLGD